MDIKAIEATLVKLEVKAGDTLVFTHPLRISESGKAAMQAVLFDLLPPGAKTLILDAGMQLHAILTPGGGEKV